MGKINYTLLNASVLNASRLNMTGETGKPGGGAGGYWPAGTPAAIRRSAVLWYDIALQGATNETMAANPVLKDLSGHGHDAKCYNFDWAGMSGIGGYKWIFDDFNLKNFPYSGNTITFTHSDKTTFEHCLLKAELIALNMLPGTSVKVTGMQSGDSILLYSKIEGTIGGVSSSIVKQINIVKDGTYSLEDNILPESYIEGLKLGYFGFKSIKINEGHEVIVEQLPLYPNALVSDGVDDYALVEGLPILTKERGYTIIAKREWLTDIVRSVGFLSSKNASENGAFCFEYSSSTVKKTISFGGKEMRTTFAENKVVWQTKDNYNGTLQLTVGDKDGIDSIAIFRQYVNLNIYYADIAFYSLLLFDRDLTAEEIEWVKANIMADPEPEPTPELDASLVDAWVFSGYRNEDAPKSVTGEKGHAMTLRNFSYTAGSGFDGGCLVTDGVDDYGICADFPIKDTYTVIVKFATLNGKLFSAVCSTTYFDDSGTRLNGISPIYIAPNVPYALYMGRRKNVAASSELAAVWMNKEAFCGEAYDDTSGLYTPPEGQECTFYFGRLDDRGIYGGYKLAYWACYDKVMTQEEAEAEIAKLDALWEARKG